jgi:hypothetical protein
MRAAVAIGCGGVVGVLTFLGGWRQTLMHGPGFFPEHFQAFVELGQLHEQVREYEKAHGKLPAALSSARDQPGRLPDPWGHDYHYELSNDSYILLSYGRDGMPGGVGLDEDIRRLPGQPPQFSATLRQFAQETPSGGITLASVVAGIGTAIACGVLSGRTASHPPEAKLVTWGLTLGTAIVAAQFMAYLHIPTGH